MVTRHCLPAALWHPIWQRLAAAAPHPLMTESHWRAQVVLAALVIADCTSFMPRNPNENDDPILQASLLACSGTSIWTDGPPSEPPAPCAFTKLFTTLITPD